MNIGEVYEIQESWFKPAPISEDGHYTGWTNETTRSLIPDMKVGAKVEILEIDDYGVAGATMIKIDGGEAIHIEQSPIGSYVWNFFDELEVSRGELKLVGEAQ